MAAIIEQFDIQIVDLPTIRPHKLAMQDIEEAERMFDLHRHRRFKLKIGADEPARDIAHVAAIKAPWGTGPVSGWTSTRRGAKQWQSMPAVGWPMPASS
jgi:hypothetical protein